MGEYALAALIFGLSAGLKPGPLALVVIQQSLEHGARAGMRASLAPIFTDGPIIAAVFLLFGAVRDITPFAAALSGIGGAYLLWIAWKLVTPRAVRAATAGEAPRSLSTAIKTNLLNPAPYLFWFTVGGSYVVLGTTAQSVLFVTVAIGTLVLTKMAIAWSAARLRPTFDGVAYRWTMRLLGGAMALLGVALWVKGLGLLIGGAG
ncbi:LysE family translocator [Endothiovibrio diazotrophicus]